MIGYSDEEEGLKYYEEFYYADSKDVAALEVFDHLQRQGYTHIEILSITLMADKGMEIQSDEQLMEKYRKLKGNYVPDWFRDMPTRYKVEIIDEIEDGYEGEKPEGDEFARGGSIESKRERVLDYYINNEDDETLNFEFDIPERALENRDKYYKEIFEKISDQFEDEEIYYKFRELNLDEASEEPEDYAKGGNIENQYSNKTSKQVYELWDYGQKWEFFKDHFLNKGVYSHSEYKNLPSKKYEELDKSAKDALDEHIKGGQYADGGNIEATIKQRLSKSFELPLQMAIYVPSTKDKNVVISKDELAYRVKVVEKYLATLFGGFNSAKVDGGFQSVDKGVINEDAVRVVAFANPEGFEPKFEKLVNKVKEWCRLWSQESIGLEFENDLFYIEQDSKFAKGGMFKNIVKIGGGPEELLRYVNTTIKDRSERDSVRIAKEYQKVIDSKFDERAYNNYKELIKETEIPKDDLQKIETYVMTTPRENRRDIDIYRYWSLKDLSKGWEGKSMPTDDRREMIKRFPKFAKGGKVKNPAPDYPDFVSMQYADGGEFGVKFMIIPFKSYNDMPKNPDNQASFIFKGTQDSANKKAQKFIIENNFYAAYVKKINEVGKGLSKNYYVVSKDKIQKAFEDGGMMAKGGQMAKKPAKFKDKVKAISKSLEGKKVPKRVRKDYGATYDKKESMDAAKRIAGSMAKKERKRYEI